MALARDDGIRDAEPAGRLSIKFTRLFLFSAIFNHTFDRPKRATLPFEGPPRRAVVVRPSDQRHRGHLEREEHPRLRLVLAELRALRHGARLGGRRARPVKQAVVEHAGAVQEQDGVRDCREPALVRGELRKGRQGNHHERDPAGPLEKVVWVPAQAPQPELRAVVRRRPDDGGAVPVFLGLADEGSHLQVGRVLEDPAARPACGADECPAHRVRRLSVRGYEEHRTREYHRVGVGLHEGVLLLLQPPEALGGHQALIILTLSHLLQYNRSQYQLLAGACSEVLLLSSQSKPLDREFRIGRLDRLNRIVMWMLFYCVRTDREFTSFVGFLSTPLLLIL